MRTKISAGPDPACNIQTLFVLDWGRVAHSTRPRRRDTSALLLVLFHRTTAVIIFSKVAFERYQTQFDALTVLQNVVEPLHRQGHLSARLPSALIPSTNTHLGLDVLQANGLIDLSRHGTDSALAGGNFFSDDKCAWRARTEKHNRTTCVSA